MALLNKRQQNLYNQGMALAAEYTNPKGTAANTASAKTTTTVPKDQLSAATKAATEDLETNQSYVDSYNSVKANADKALKNATITDTKDRDAYLYALSAQLQQQQAMYDQMDAMYRQQYEAQQRQLAAEREAAKRNAYINNQVALKNLPTELAADGINGGLAESSRVRLHTAMNRNMAGADYLYNQDVANAYQNMLNNKAGVAQNRANASLNYNAAAAKAPEAKVYENEAALKQFIASMGALGYTDEEIAKKWNEAIGL